MTFKRKSIRLGMFTVFLLCLVLNFCGARNIPEYTREGQSSNLQDRDINIPENFPFLDKFHMCGNPKSNNFKFQRNRDRIPNEAISKVFYENLGHFPDYIYYYTIIPGGILGFGVSQTVFFVEGQIISITFAGSNPVQPQGGNFFKSYSNYFYGSEAFAQVRHCQKIIFKELYDGISLVYKFAPQGLKYDFIIEPYAHINQIQMIFEGADEVHIEPIEPIEKT
ncbi:MAG: hypothetical protein ACFFBD_25315 [Candidatus Hodarchaeota archaeon]